MSRLPDAPVARLRHMLAILRPLMVPVPPVQPMSRRRPIGRPYAAGAYTVRQIGPTRRLWYILRPNGRRAVLRPYATAGAAIAAAQRLPAPP
jgi:hypothetical protein